MRRSSKFITRPTHLSLFIQVYVKEEFLYIPYSSAFYLIFHTPRELVGPNIFRRIFLSKDSILFTACLRRVHASNIHHNTKSDV
jgi:hypothetical protein